MHLVDIATDKVQYRPGQPVVMTLTIDNPEPIGMEASVEVEVLHLHMPVEVMRFSRFIPPGPSTINAVFSPNVSVAKSFGIEVRVDGKNVCSSAFDVCPDWTSGPRYGFMCDFSPDENDTEYRLGQLARLHINGLHFYDNIHRHDQLAAAEELFTDPMGRLLSKSTIEAKVREAKRWGMAAMTYASVYSASYEFFRSHQDWVMRRPDGVPHSMALTGNGLQDRIYLMDPRGDSLWTQHLASELISIIDEFGFDGAHVDQYGFPESAVVRRDGLLSRVDVAAAFGQQAKTLKESLGEAAARYHRKGCLVFNAVNGWGLPEVADCVDLVYIETVWNPGTTYSDIASSIAEARVWTGGRPVVLSAYPPVELPAIRLLDSVICASGGTRMAVGEGDCVLTGSYFPGDKRRASPEVLSGLQTHYDFITRYSDLLYDGSYQHCQLSPIEPGSLSISGARGVSDECRADSVWMLTRCGLVHLINLSGVQDLCWATHRTSPPKPVSDLSVSLKDGETLYYASPDVEGGKAIKIGEDGILPPLHYWALLYAVSDGTGAPESL